MLASHNEQVQQAHEAMTYSQPIMSLHLSQELSNSQNSLENKVISTSEISYGWSTSTGYLSLFTKAQGNASQMYSMNELFGSNSSFGFGSIGMKFDNKFASAAAKFSLSAEIQGLNGGLGANSSSSLQDNVADDNQQFTLEGKLSF